jgi:thimet oligopeptidase
VKKVERFTTQCLAGLRRAEALRKDITTSAPGAVLEGKAAASSDGKPGNGKTARSGQAAAGSTDTLVRYNELLTAASTSNALAGLMSEVHPDEAIRDAARECEQQVARFYSDLWLDRQVYDALASVDVRGSDDETRRFLAHTLRDYRRAGVDKSPEVRARLLQIDEELTKLGQNFSKTISEDVRAIEVGDPARLAGLPADYIAAHPPGADGKVRITTDYPDYNPFMTYAVDDELRRQLYIAFRSRGDRHNETTLREILKLRAEKAKLLGYADWADYITADKMIGSGARAAEFIDKVWKLAAPRAEQDYKELLRQLQAMPGSTKPTAVADWQKTWLENLVKKERYEVDASEVRQYFPYDRVLAGLLQITAEIFDLTYAEVSDAERWHPSVLVYDVVRGETTLGRIYLDMHPRDGKYKHAAQFPLKDGVRGVQLPEGVLVCNFPVSEPATATRAACTGLMEHDDVVTMFHEFGHLMHHVLGGHQRWITQSGVATEWDFVEAPSQMFEEWAWRYDTLARFARHHETGEVIPKALVDKMRRADKFGLGTATVQQIFYAAISLGFHRTDPESLDQLAEVQRLQKRYTPFAYVPGTRFHASFGHLVGYSAMYYTYQWSLVIAKDLLTPFESTGLMATDVTYAYRDRVLVPGGTRDAAELVRSFLGRDYEFSAYEQFLLA